jgi:hypothetical protein
MIAQTVLPDTDPCELAARWRIHPKLASGVVRMVPELPFQIQVISGFRTLEEQQALITEGRGAALDKSTHVTCPATGVDLWPILAVTDVVKATLGAAGTYAGLRWGGGSPPDSKTGIPSDWNHFDLGPR